MKKILMIGAGAVAQAHGYKFAKCSDVELVFFVREQYKNALASGMTLFDLNHHKKKKTPIRFQNYRLISTFEEIAQESWTQIHFTISSDALRKFEFTELRIAVANNTTLVLLQPIVNDNEVILKHFPADQIVRGSISVLSYFSPLPSETKSQSGVAFWFPFRSKTYLSGSSDRTQAVNDLYNAAGISCDVDDTLSMRYLIVSVYLMLFIAALQKSNWDFKALFRNRKLLNELDQCKRQTIRAIELTHSIKAPAIIKYMPSRIIPLGFTIAKSFTPFDLEEFIVAHFQKLEQQTQHSVEQYKTIVSEQGLDDRVFDGFSMNW